VARAQSLCLSAQARIDPERKVVGVVVESLNWCLARAMARWRAGVLLSELASTTAIHVALQQIGDGPVPDIPPFERTDELIS
jgi:hypothetical protein